MRLRTDFKNKLAGHLRAVFVVLIIAAIGTYLLLGSHAASPYGAGMASTATPKGATTIQPCAGSSSNYCAVFGGNGNPIVLTQGASRSLNPDFLGYNRDGSAKVMADPNFIPALQKVDPETLRGIVGGTPANYFNWRTGQYFITAQGTQLSYKPGNPNPPFTLSDYANNLKAVNADAVFNLNVMTYCPANEADPVSNDQAAASCTVAQACGPNPSEYTTECTNTDYTWGLAYQIAMLRAAKSMGIPIKYIELGNELYISNFPDDPYYFPAPQAYVNKVNAWIPVLKQDFPGAEIAVIGDPHVTGSHASICQTNVTGSTSAWNQAVINSVHGENAITFHTYYSSYIADGGSVDNPQDLSSMLSQAPQSCYSNLQQKLLPLLPAGVTAWISEWNLWSENTQVVHGSWAQGLTEADYALDLARTPQVELADNHDLAGGSTQVYGSIFPSSGSYKTTAEFGKPIGVPSPLPATQQYGLTAGGFALSALQRSLHGATRTTTLNLGPTPTVAGTSVPGLAGQSFLVGSKTNLYFVNLSNQAAVVNLAGLAGHYSVLQYATSPINFVTGDSSISAGSFAATDSVNIPGYSVTSLVSQ